MASPAGRQYLRKKILDSQPSAEKTADRVQPLPASARMTLEQLFAADKAELDEEEKDSGPSRLFTPHSKPSAQEELINFLPPALRPFLKRMEVGRRREREAAIIDKVGWKALRLLDLNPSALRSAAEKEAWRYGLRFPADDPQYQSADHRRGRDPKVWRSRLKKQVKKARTRIAQLVGAVGGVDVPGRPLYVSDYGIQEYDHELRQSYENMKDLRIVNVDDPAAQISMLDAHKRKKNKEMAKRRLLLDVHMVRADIVAARAIWITTTLDGEYHCNPTNSGGEVKRWNIDLGPDEAMKESQKRHHQTMCLLREQGVRSWGFWDAQAQQDSTPHRHLLAFVHDTEMTEKEVQTLLSDSVSDNVKSQIQASADKRVLEKARAVAVGFRNRFPGTYGCKAYVLGDSHPDFAPPHGKNGTEETAVSIMKYMSRYATRMATGFGEMTEVEGEEGASVPPSDEKRHAVWANERDARLHNWIGVDSQRAAMRVWDCIWKAADRGEIPDDPRMELAVSMMMLAQEHLQDLLVKKAELAEYLKGVELPDADEFVNESNRQLRVMQSAVSATAYHSAVAMGLWADQDLHIKERLWLKGQLDLAENEELPLPPIPIRQDRENVYGEEVRETTGIAAPIILKEGDSDSEPPSRADRGIGEILLTDAVGSWKLVRASDDTRQQIILKTGEWVIVDSETAKRMSDEVVQVRNDAAKRKQDEQNKRLEKVDEWKALRAAYAASEALDSMTENCVAEGKETIDLSSSPDGLSLIPIYPRIGPDGPPTGDFSLEGGPPES
ncbi:MAG: replication endonuclease [Alphaproteobacteria bacterium]|nr:replication endonuclease [Alphaproteobacteria bacterium]MBU1549975.1 replication endonuclease [Alphaproteobacteria bacterium]MBU2336569.1 replication endonuclease [Alphaproteobacteria bacterium]MBU2387302.1 replication endonuclease [Alphaproteobacteria bacterium]